MSKLSSATGHNNREARLTSWPSLNVIPKIETTPDGYPMNIKRRRRHKKEGWRWNEKYDGQHWAPLNGTLKKSVQTITNGNDEVHFCCFHRPRRHRRSSLSDRNTHSKVERDGRDVIVKGH